MARQVSKTEYDAAVAAYPRPLTQHSIRFCEPPLLTLLDGDRRVFYCEAEWMGPNGETDVDGDRFWRYFIED